MAKLQNSKAEMNPSTSPLPPLLRLILLLLHLPSSPASFLEDTCSAITTARPDIPCDLCISSLGADPNSCSADRRGLAVIATRLSIANATNTTARVQQLIDAGPESKTADCLSVCLEVYCDAADHLRDAVCGIESGDYSEAVTYLSAALDAAENCEDAFKDAGISSPMVKEDRGFEMMAEIALAIATTLD